VLGDRHTVQTYGDTQTRLSQFFAHPTIQDRSDYTHAAGETEKQTENTLIVATESEMTTPAFSC